MKTKEQIVEWLKDNGYYERMQVQTNLKKGIDWLIDDSIEDGTIRHLIAQFRVWKNTREGNAFWWHVHIEFHKWINSI